MQQFVFRIENVFMLVGVSRLRKLDSVGVIMDDAVVLHDTGGGGGGIYAANKMIFYYYFR